MVHEIMSSLVSPGDGAYDGAIIVSVSCKTGTKNVCVSDGLMFLESVLNSPVLM